MSYERLSDVKVKGDGLDVFIENITNSYLRQLSIRNAKDETDFQNSVLENNLSLDEQLAYRKEQLKKVSDDPNERKRVRAEIANLKDRIEQRKYTDEYIQKLTDYQSGVESIDGVITWLEDQLGSATDDTVRQSILEQLNKQKAAKFEETKKLIQNKTDYAVNDKSESVLNDQMIRVKEARSLALSAGNNELVSAFDLQLQSLGKALKENNIEKDILNFATTTMSGYSSATGLLDAYANKITSADVSGPVTVGGTTYSSAREFWSYKRDEYLTDTSSAGFFNRFNTEQNNKLKVANSQNKLGMSDVLDVKNEYNRLLQRSDLQNYATQIALNSQDSIQTGADFLADKIQTEFSTTYDANKAIAELDNIKTLGANIDKVFANVVKGAADIKTNQVSQILDTTKKIMENDPTVTAENAIDQAVKTGAGAVISPSQAVAKSETDIAKDLAKGAETTAFGNEPRTTATTAPASPDIVKPTTEGPQAQTPAVPAQPTPSINITSQLDLGAKSEEVRALQKFLNKAGYLVASSGAGSVGQETDYFGPLTQAALQKFQTAQGIVSTGDAKTTGYGRLGPQTLEAIKKFKI